MHTITPFSQTKRKFIHYKRNFAKQAPLLRVVLCLALPLLLLVLPLPWLHLEDLSALQHRTVFLFALAAVFWIMEPIPIYATSILIIFLELVLLSDSSLRFLAVGPEEGAALLGYKEILGTFASPIIILFLGGFFLAIAATKYRLDRTMARLFIRPFGTSPKWVMLGLMVITAVFSMFMSNTATTAMMLSIVMPILASLEAGDKGKIGFILSIPVAANIGGLGTPIGTPPNAIAMKYLGGAHDITFAKWMVLGVPYVLVMLLIAWLLLRYMFPTATKTLEMDTEPAAQKKLTFRAIMIYLTFGLTVVLWLTDFVHGMNAYIVAMVPIVVFLCFGILDKDDFKLISWDVLWLVSGGIALGLALDRTGLARVIVDSIPFHELHPLVLFIFIALIGIVVANFMSNTATANLLLPIVAVLATTIPGLAAYGGVKLLLLSTTLCLSLGMALPISTPPNALAYSTGLIETGHMARVGVIVGAIGLVMAFVMIYVEKTLGLL